MLDPAAEQNNTANNGGRPAGRWVVVPEVDPAMSDEAPQEEAPDSDPNDADAEGPDSEIHLDADADPGAAAEIGAESKRRSRHPRGGLRGRIPWLFRRAWVIFVVTSIVVAVAVALSAGKAATYSSDATLFVLPGASSTSPGSASDAQALAATYAGLIPNDASVLDAVSSVTGLSQDEVKKATSVTVLNGTSLLDVRFTDVSPGAAALGAAYISSAISGNHPVTNAIPSGSIAEVHGASAPVRHTTKFSEIILLGIVLGLLLAAVIVIIWERADARVDRPDQVTAVLGIPARSFAGLSAEGAEALIDRWRALTFSDAPTVALVAAVPGIESSTERVGDRLRLLTHDAKLFAAGAPGSENGDSVAQHADLTVLVVPRETKVRDLLHSNELLEQYGVKAAWALMVNREKLWRA
jgi:capsular polysaccharide biosynthesis protein